MSKASEYAKALKGAAAVQPEDFRDPRQNNHAPGPYLRLHVNESGYCNVKCNDNWMLTAPPDVILAAARWIIATFGEVGAPASVEPGETAS